MADDKLQLTEFDYNAQAADELAQSPGYEADDVEVIDLSSDRPLSDRSRLGPSTKLEIVQPDGDPGSPDDENVQRHSTAYSTPENNRQQQQPSSADKDTPKWISCTPRQWTAIGICILIKIIVIFIIIWIKTHAHSYYH